MPDGVVAFLAEAGWGGVALVVGAVLVGGFVRGFIGFGAAMITVPIFTLALGPLVALPAAALIGLPTTVQLLPTAVRFAERPLVVPMALGCFVAAPVGTWILVSVPPEYMKIAIALIVLLMVALMSRGWQPKRPLGIPACFAAGIVSGLVQGTAGVGGPPVVATALSRPGPPERQRANVIGAMSAMPLCSIPPLLWYGLITKEVLVIALTIIPLQVAATWLGAKFFSDRGRDHFRKAALVALAIIGVATLGFAVRDALAG